MYAKKITLLLCLLATAVQAQKVQFEGLKRTKPTYLLKFMGWEQQVPTDSASIARGEQRIRNTRFFNEVSSRVVANAGDTTVVFTCPEIFTVLPIIEFGASEGNKWFRVGIEDENGLGRGVRTIAFYQHNDRHSYYLKQSFPLLFKQWGVNYLFKKWSILEPIGSGETQKTYHYTNWDVEALAQYSFDINRNNLEAGVGYIREIYELPMGDMPEMRAVADYARYVWKANHYLNFQDHHSFYVSGWSSKTFLLGSYFLHNASLFGSFLNETKYFKIMPRKGNLALRARVGVSSNVNVFLAPFVLDNYYNIRGIGNRIDRGTASVTLNAEYRQTVWENRNFGIQAVGFTDMGAIRPSGSQISALGSAENIRVFAGMGGRFIYKKAYECDLRIDYGVGLHGEGRGFVIGLGQYF